ncbi:MAG: hypothetical protein COV59_05350 [Candidatus Magasanikbacteria bacterium CG11_big_fil_rev_8_21_14_0_20_39_34]|uniref:Methyltransferase domain-containing protein n=1 Tax=Candidatus Magasanikbacteria bacterium CG11_big_fil_rev_8_21_14_0_20_39_34 TaxID=1974653 RepID=A0A2H0N655_9BACT|nr:MAG: hypothetical protein COV59_05350 [Candidatus Magasanikbacteria bacterium CG11_big_fil_rev_8_21_14_0_20_39_34]
MFSSIAKKNLEKDSRVLGKAWEGTYGGYFSDKKNIQNFLERIIPFLPEYPLDILYVASASGILGEAIIRYLGKGNLTLVDISQKHLNANNNPNTKKICCDLLNLDLRKKFDLVVMRSSLDYFPTRESQVKVLKIIKDHIKKNGLFINQPAYVSNMKDRDIISHIYTSVEKIGDRLFQSEDLEGIYIEAGYKQFKKIGEGEKLIITQEDHIKRYNLGEDDIAYIQSIITQNSSYAEKTEDGYILRFDFPIFLANI